MARRSRLALALPLALALCAAVPSVAAANERDDRDGARRDFAWGLRLDEMDVRGPVRVGAGHSALLRAPVVSLSFQSEVAMARRGPAELTLVFGMDGYRGPDRPDAEGARARRGFLVVDGGVGLGLHLGRPLLSLAATAGPGWQSGGESLSPHGFGVAGRAAFFPLYVGLVEAVRCERGWFSSYVLSGLSVWGLARRDWVGIDSGSTVAAGIGFDLGRNVVLPVLHQAMTGRCGA